MAIIIHRCTTCTHPDLFHDDREDGSTGGCSYGCRTAGPHTFGPPEVIPTWIATRPIGAAVPDPVLAEPGSHRRPLPRLCDCADCWALYHRETGVAA
ncbi:hypothetical protein ATK36_0489 [Amycolatopsis sulphurea]|uniref:Uncharacterized protein n=1 Tax=Amycolatopsis sulphurea TaxID=76022 RepID=A0A2A9G1B2_9PSEU|nr:hypothetical protein [Amycolatopsis sulphurea]PFG56953.1 hypothetical protein ATK36_0489 [Amycolatopsis sulphurea]